MAENKANKNDKNDLTNLIKQYSKHVRNFETGDVVEGVVVGKDKKFILLDVGAKSEGLIPAEEIKFLSEKTAEIGQKIVATVVQSENRQGNLMLSLKKAKSQYNWDTLKDLSDDGENIEVTVVDYLNGGLIVDAQGQRGFVPISHLSRLHFEQFNAAMAEGNNSETAKELGGLRGTNLIVKIIEIDAEKNRLVMSEKEVMSKDELNARGKRMSEIKIGDILEGTVSTVLPYGILVDLGGVDGLVHISEIAWEKVSSPSDYFKSGDKITVKVIGKDAEKIALSVKELKDNPWNNVEERYPLGKKVKATVSKVVPFGAFIELEPGLDGLIHISETVGPLNVGDEVEAIVVNVDSKERKLALSIRQIEDAKIYR
jgi:small subunit ribosomal protein S1